MLVYQKIAAVSAELAKVGISKDRRNQQQNYAFRGIEDVLNTLAPLLAEKGLVILPRILSRECVERETKSGGSLFSVTVSAAFDFVAAEDGSAHTVQTFGEAMDSADKATNKAMSAAYKYAAFLAFCIPTEVEDADATTPEASTRVAQPAKAQVTHATVALISEPQRKRFYAIWKGRGWQEHEVKALLKRTLGVESSAEIPVHRYDEICKVLDQGVEAGTR